MIEEYQGHAIFLSQEVHTEYVDGMMFQVDAGKYFTAVEIRDKITARPQRWVISCSSLTGLKARIDEAGQS